MKYSIKHLLRQRGKVLLFFLLMLIGTSILVMGAALLISTNRSLDSVEQQFATIGTVKQNPDSVLVEQNWNSCLGAHSNPINVYENLLSTDILNFDGANYIGEPESRTYYLTTQKEWMSFGPSDFTHNSFILTFSPLSDADGSEPTEVAVQQVLYSNVLYEDVLDTPGNLHSNDVIPLCQHFSESPIPLEKGKTYVAKVVWQRCSNHSDQFYDGEYVVYQRPHTTVDTSSSNGEPFLHIRGSSLKFPSLNDPSIGVQEIDTNNADHLTKDGWFEWTSATRRQYSLTPVLATNDLELLPSYHKGKMKIVAGRPISEEEFASGAKVCLMPEEFVYESWKTNPTYLMLGSKLTLPLLCGLSSYDPGVQYIGGTDNYSNHAFMNRYSLIDESGKTFSPFVNDEYEVVGSYHVDEDYYYNGDTELIQYSIIVPSKSIQPVEEMNIAYVGPMNENTTSFRIPNGSIEEFDKALHEMVPEIEQLTISYDDNGYSQVADELHKSRNTAILLFSLGTSVSVSIIVLLFYFFIVRQKRRTAIERSFGLSKKECWVSLMGGIMLVSLLALIIGTICGFVFLNSMNEITASESNDFITKFSDWSEPIIKIDEQGLSSIDIGIVCLLGPCSILMVEFLLSLLFMERNLKISPILLLGEKGA